MTQSCRKALYAVLVMILLSLIPSAQAPATESAFRNEFIMNYIGNRFKEQEVLVKKSKDIMPGEIRALVADAMAEGRDFDTRMRLLDIANAMASMYKFWHGDEGPLHEVETIQRMEIKKEEARRAEAESGSSSRSSSATSL